MVRREAERLWRILMEIWLMKVEVKVFGQRTKHQANRNTGNTPDAEIGSTAKTGRIELFYIKHARYLAFWVSAWISTIILVSKSVSPFC